MRSRGIGEGCPAASPGAPLRTHLRPVNAGVGDREPVDRRRRAQLRTALGAARPAGGCGCARVLLPSGEEEALELHAAHALLALPDRSGHRQAERRLRLAAAAPTRRAAAVDEHAAAQVEAAKLRGRGPRAHKEGVRARVAVRAADDGVHVAVAVGVHDARHALLGDWR